jgi:hypothetical protein
MPDLIVIEKIDGTPVAWRCSDCRQKFSVRGKLTMQERERQAAVEFKAHLEEHHKAGGYAGGMAFAAGVPLPE